MVILLNQGIPFDVSGPLELFKNLNFAFMIPFLAAVFVASRSFVETKLTYNMFSRLIPALKSVLDARCNRERDEGVETPKNSTIMACSSNFFRFSMSFQ